MTSSSFDASTTWPGALAAGACGALALTAVHESARRYLKHPPRMDSVAARAIARSMRKLGATAPDPVPLHRWALAGDLVSNSLYYAMVARGCAPWMRGAALGLAAGIGAVVLPPRIGLGHPPNSEHTSTQLLTVAWYLIGGLAAAAAARRFNRATISHASRPSS